MEDEKKCRVGGMYESNLLLGEAPDYFYKVGVLGVLQGGG